MKKVEHPSINYYILMFSKVVPLSCPAELSLRWRQYMYVIYQLMGACRNM
jgi:hypothetical protein